MDCSTEDQQLSAVDGKNSSQTESSKQCSGCSGQISDRFLLYALDNYWHTNCLKCGCCQMPLGELGTTCFCKNGMILCKKDYLRLFGHTGSCSSCGQSIPASEFVMRAQGQVYHMKCFACATCHNQLVPGDRYSMMNGNIFCEQDYPKFNSKGVNQTMKSSHKIC